MSKNIYTTIATLVLAVSLLQINMLVQGLGLTQRLWRGEATRPTGNVVTATAPQSTTGLRPAQISAEKISLDLPVVSVPLTHGTWAVNAKTANYAEGTSFVNQDKGNVGIYAHDTLEGFSNIKKLQIGDQIRVTGEGFAAVYEVQATSVVTSDSISVFYPSDRPELTLLTCDGVFSEKRYMVKANLKELNKNL